MVHRARQVNRRGDKFRPVQPRSRAVPPAYRTLAGRAQTVRICCVRHRARR